MNQNNNNKPMPEEIRGWNWGAFFLHWIWGIGNNVWIALLSLIPFFGLIWMFVLGAKGNEWAWKHRHWESVAEFKQTQRRWGWAGLIIWCVVILIAIVVAVSVPKGFEHSVVSQASLQRVQQDARVRNLLGTPIKRVGMTSGFVRIYERSGGKMQLIYEIKGPKGKAMVYVQGIKLHGNKRYPEGWHITYLVVKGQDNRLIELTRPLK